MIDDNTTIRLIAEIQKKAREYCKALGALIEPGKIDRLRRIDDDQACRMLALLQSTQEATGELVDKIRAMYIDTDSIDARTTRLPRLKSEG